MKKKLSRLINPNAKKYTTQKNFKITNEDGKTVKVSLKQKQAMVNRNIRWAKENLPKGSEHRRYKETMDKIHYFQKKHGQTRKNTLSMESLRVKDIDIYDNLLDSILDSTYMNPDNYEKYTCSFRRKIYHAEHCCG